MPLCVKFLLHVLCISNSQPPAGIDPLDAFKANLNSIEVALEFDFRAGWAKSSEACSGRLWSRQQVTLVRERPLQCWTGRWESDGRTERLVSIQSEESRRVWEEALKSGADQVPVGPSMEYLFDGDVVAFHEVGEPYANAYPGSAGQWHTRAPGPFRWFHERFPLGLESWLKANAATTQVRLVPRVHGGFATEDLIVSSTEPLGKAYVVAFDPAIGFLPRYYRRWSYNAARDSAAVYEMYLLDAQRCAAGGFVPTHWATLGFAVPKFRRRHPDFDVEESLDCPDSEVSVVEYFRVTSFENRTPDPSLHCDDGFKGLQSVGGEWRTEERPTTLDMTTIRRALGDQIFATPAPAPAINLAELEEFNTPPRNWNAWLLAATLLAVGALLLLGACRRYRGVKVVLLISVALAMGCGDASPRIEAKFAQDVVPIEYDYQRLRLPLVVRNTGNRTLHIEAVRTSCVCSLADRNSFPTTIEPGKNVSIDVMVEKRFEFTPQFVSWTFVTDHGELTATSRLLMFPRAKLSPYQQSYARLQVGEPHAFKVLAQQVAREGEPWPQAALRADDGVTVIEKAVRTGRGPAQGYRFQETTYEIAVVDDRLGEHKRELALVTEEGKRLAHAFVLWKRVPPLWTTPDTIYVSDRSVRVFLGSKDEDVEFVRVLETPQGIEATITGPRIVTLRPTAQADASIKGVVVVETNAQHDPILRVPLVRYAAVRERTGQFHPALDRP